MSQELHHLIQRAQQAREQRRRVQAILDCRGCASERDLLARWPHLARLSPQALAWAQQTLEAQLALPAPVRQTPLIRLLIEALEEHEGHHGG